MKRLTILICTHNRVELLEKVIHSLNTAQRPKTWAVDILVAANACSDGTHTFLDNYHRQQSAQNHLPLEFFAEPTPGKSHALNAAIPRLKQCNLIAFVDDDHRVDRHYLEAICKAADEYPDASIFCGRILPDWNGDEPVWVHDPGPYAVYPLPVPRYDQGLTPRPIDHNGPLPGGGNLALRSDVFDRVGSFSTVLGPTGHDLGGGEDSDFMFRAINSGEKVQYVPDILQHHYVDLERLKLSYLMRKSYQRSRSVTQIHSQGSSRVPRHLWRKLITYIWKTVTSLYWPAIRFYLVRTAATLGELSGFLSKSHH